jgi:hypothetical protein
LAAAAESGRSAPCAAIVHALQRRRSERGVRSARSAQRRTQHCQFALRVSLLWSGVLSDDVAASQQATKL